jgi:hypothetical protein
MSAIPHMRPTKSAMLYKTYPRDQKRTPENSQSCRLYLNLLHNRVYSAALFSRIVISIASGWHIREVRVTCLRSKPCSNRKPEGRYKRGDPYGKDASEEWNWKVSCHQTVRRLQGRSSETAKSRRDWDLVSKKQGVYFKYASAYSQPMTFIPSDCRVRHPTVHRSAHICQAQNEPTRKTDSAKRLPMTYL